MFECREILVCELPLPLLHLLLKATCTHRTLLRSGFRFYTSYTRTNTILYFTSS